MKHITLLLASIISMIPGTSQNLEKLTSYASYYIIRWRTKNPLNLTPSSNAGGSQFYDWFDIPAKPIEKGYHRQFMNRPTATLKELEMHVTTLNEGISSHGEHIHESEEMVIIMKGEVEKSIHGKQYKLGSGSLILLMENIPHGIRNAGNGPCEYFAFRWE